MATWDTDDNGEIVWANTAAGRDIEMHIAAHSLTKLTAKMSRDPINQREHRHACDSEELGERVADHLRAENYGRPLDRR
ncbi:hypothetical protein [Nonomuraea bangladeshensis]|uniref:hypothetical protein n=1 Tax=Nonomuraea bangladeshensis TaxID=404385 RepID=UPI003C2BB354